MGESGTRARDLMPPAPPVWAPVGRRWAVLVGISTYRDSALDLQFADRDATELFDLLVTPEGGGFDPTQVKLLINEEATTTAVTRAVRGFLLEAVPEDLVLLFVACHGGPDPRRPAGPLYLYTHDTDRSDVAGTAFPMDDIDNALRQLIQAQRVVIIADTCHSAAIGGPRTRASVTAEATNRYLDAMAQAKGGVALLTSAEAAEASQEDARWGGGHGVFTHHLLQGMRGAADGYGGSVKDGIVSVGELFEYVREQVKRDTNGTQHPAIGTTLFDRKLPMAVTGDLQVEQYLALGRALLDVGWILDDPAPMLLAAQQFTLARDFGRNRLQADIERGRALLAAGDAEAAATTLRGAIADPPDEPDPTVWRDLGLAEAECGRGKAAAAALSHFLDADGDHTDAPWVRRHLEWLTQRPGGVRALLVGVGTFPNDSRFDLPGVANDLELVADVLHTTLEVPDDRIAVCKDEDASLEGVRAAFDLLRDQVRPDEVVFMYFTGHSVATAGENDPFLVTYADLREGAVGITPRELVAALDLPCRGVTLVLDTHISPAFVALAGEQERIVTLLGCAVGEVAYEKQIDGLPHGLFTASLVAELRSATNLSYGALMERVRERLRSDSDHLGQTPRLAGRHDGPVLGGHFEDEGLWRALRRAVPRPADDDVLRRAAEGGLPAARWARARALLAQGQPSLALAEFPDLDTGGPEEWALATDVAIAHLNAGEPEKARAALATASAAITGDRNESLAAAAATLDSGPPPDIVVLAPLTAATGASAAERVDELRSAAASAVGRADASIELYGPGQATVAVMRSVLTRLCRNARPAVIVFAGSATTTGDLRYVLSDGALSAREMRGITTGAGHVVAILELDLAPEALHRRLEFKPSVSDLGALGVPVALVTSRGRSTFALLEALPGVWTQGSTFGDWVALAGDSDQYDPTELVPSPVGSAPVAAHAAWMLSGRALERTRRAAASEAAQLARIAIAARDDERDPYPQGYLQLGLALAAEGRPDEALDVLRTARNLYDDPTVTSVERVRDSGFKGWRREANYHFGRLLAEYGDDLFEAVASLRTAERGAQDDARIQLHLALGLKALIERETLVEARAHARRYLELGAPFGLAEAMSDFVLDVPAQP